MTEPINAPAIKWSGLLLCGMPLIYYMFTLLFYVCVSISLGQWANTMGMHDPKAFFAGIPACLNIILMIFSFAVVPLVVFVGYRNESIARHVLIYGIFLTLCILLFRFVTPWL